MEDDGKGQKVNNKGGEEADTNERKSQGGNKRRTQSVNTQVQKLVRHEGYTQGAT